MATRVLTGVRVLLQQGVTYRARVRVDAPKWLATKGAIASRFEDEGFVNVIVYKDVEELPPDWPLDQRAQIPGSSGFTAWIEGTWPKPDEARVRPEPVIAMWVQRAPPGLASPTTSAPEGSHKWAREIVRLAWQAWFHELPNDATAQAVQAIALHESGDYFGVRLPDGSPSHNWGSIQCGRPPCAPSCFEHQDKHADGTPYIACFKQYPEPFFGAKDFVHELVVVTRRKAVLDAIGYGNATVIAREMRASGYFEASVSSYADAVGRRARTIAASLGEPVYVAPTSFLAGGASLALVAGAVFLGYRKGVNL